jgi:hypothetical protein
LHISPKPDLSFIFFNPANSCRFQREEVKIQAWENHQRAKYEAEMKRIEVYLEMLTIY